MPERCQSVIYDDRCEVFLWPVVKDNDNINLDEQTYYAFEVNRDGRALLSKTQFHRKFDFEWNGKYDGAMILQAENSSDTADSYEIFLLRIYRNDVGMSDSNRNEGQEFRIGLHRGMAIRKEEDINGDMAWASWVNPADDLVDFHRPEMFGTLSLN